MQATLAPASARARAIALPIPVTRRSPRLPGREGRHPTSWIVLAAWIRPVGKCFEKQRLLTSTSRLQLSRTICFRAASAHRAMTGRRTDQAASAARATRGRGRLHKTDCSLAPADIAWSLPIAPAAPPGGPTRRDFRRIAMRPGIDVRNHRNSRRPASARRPKPGLILQLPAA